MTSQDTIETPAVVVDFDVVEKNLRRAQNVANEAGVILRPHIKTHKLPMLVKRQVEHGAAGITCQKVSEAEVMVSQGLRDILLPYNIVGPRKLDRLRLLSEKCALSVTADHISVVEGYQQAMHGAPAPLPVLVECDTGQGRCGVQTPDAAVEVARAVAQCTDLRFTGLMTYPAAGGHAEANNWLEDAIEQLRAAGLEPEVVTTGGSPDLWGAIRQGPATEYRPGTYIYMDRSLVEAGVCSIEDCALRVVATVVSTPTPGRAILDAGSKSLTSDTLGLDGFGFLPAYPEARIASLSEEHGIVDATRCTTTPRIGERVEIIPNHACVVSNLFDEVWIGNRSRDFERVPVAARGCVT